MLGEPLFVGESGVDQLVEIIKILGTPSREKILAMNPEYTTYNFPDVKPLPWEKVFRKGTPLDAINFVSRLLCFDPV